MREDDSNYEPAIRYTLALVLAGGRGRRLRGLTRWRVKPAVPFAGKYRIIDFALSNCINSGIRQIGVLTQYKSQSLIRHLSRGWGMFHRELGEFIEILPAQQRLAKTWYQGTADAVYQNIDIIRQYNPEFVLILAGDHVYKMDYGRLIRFHAERGATLTVVCNTVPLAEARRFGVMTIDERNRIVSFKEKPLEPQPLPDDPTHALISMGIYVFNAGCLFRCLLQDAESPNSSRDFGRDIITRAVAETDVFAYPFKALEPSYGNYWRDVGTVDSFWSANMELVSVEPPLNLYDESWPIRSTVDQLPPAKFVFNDEHRRGCAVNSLVSEGCILSGGFVEDSLLSKGVRIEERAHVSRSVILPRATIGPGCRIHRAIIDKSCCIPPETEIGIDVEADRERFYVSEQGVTLVIPDMLGQILHRIR